MCTAAGVGVGVGVIDGAARGPGRRWALGGGGMVRCCGGCCTMPPTSVEGAAVARVVRFATNAPGWAPMGAGRGA
jgi:hypothetical protein